MSLAIYEVKDTDGRSEMYTKLKSIISPGLVNLLFLELGFLFLAGYIGLCMWTGVTAIGNTPAMELALGLVLFFTLYRSKK